jgi:hypothetical protein
LNVVIDGEDRLRRIRDRRCADLLELRNHRAGVVVRHHMARTNRNKISGAHHGSRCESIRVSCGDFLDECEAHINFLLNKERDAHAHVNFLLNQDVDVAGACDIISIMSVPSLPLNEMTVEEKLQTMEALWQSLSADSAAMESPAWHEEELRERERKIASGEAKFVDWEKAKADIRRRTS